MRSKLAGVRERPRTLSPRKTIFVYFAFLAGLVMFLAAGALYLHAYLTMRWLADIKAEAVARAASAAAVVAPLDTGKCPSAKPVLIGFDANGGSLCRRLPEACGEGQYIASIDPETFELRCADAGALVECPAGTYVTEFMWLGEGHISFSCHPRLDPFIAWKFTPILGSRGSD